MADFGFAGCKPFYNEPIELNQEQKVFVSTIAAEALNYGITSQRAVADVITNRTTDTVSITDVITSPNQFSGYGDHNYNACMSYLNSRDGSIQVYENLISSVIFIYFNGSDIAQGSTLYYSPRSMKNGSAPFDWEFSLLDEVFISGIDSYDFKFYKYR